MTATAPLFTPQLLDYLAQINPPEHPVLAQIRAHNQAHRLGKMTVAAEQIRLLVWLSQLIRAEHYLEIGTFTGYSSTAVALALPEHAQLHCCDINVSFTDTARAFWQAAGVAHKITLHLQPALITMDDMLAQGRAGQFDLIFIDADKPPTPHYVERSLKLIRNGGIIAIDNLLLGGRIVREPDSGSPPSHSILRRFNADLQHRAGIIPITLPLGDGLTLIIKT